MVNPLRADTTAVVAQLHDADIRTVMVTGGQPLPAPSVQREDRHAYAWRVPRMAAPRPEP